MSLSATSLAKGVLVRALNSVIQNGRCLQSLAPHRNYADTTSAMTTGGSLRCGNDCIGNKSKVQMDPACKVALIFGGTTGIGYQVASSLLREGAKAVAITGLDTCRGKDAVNMLNNAYGSNKAMFINSNNNCIIQMEETFKVVKRTYDHLDIVVNSAGVLDGKMWEQELVTNLVGAIRTTLLAYQYVGCDGGKGQGGTLLHIAGVYGLEPLSPAPTLCATQHGLVGLARSFGDPAHVKRSGLRVLCLCPGTTSTDFHRNLLDKGMTPKLGEQLQEHFKASKKQRPEVVGLAAVQVIRCGPSGTVWVCDGSRLFSLKFPHWSKYSELKSQFV